MTTDFGIRLRLDGQQQVVAGADAASQGIAEIESASVKLQGAQAALAAATAKATKAQEDLNRASAGADKSKAEAAAIGLAQAQAKQAQAAIAARDAQRALDRQVGSLGKSTQIAGHQMAQMSAQLQDLFIQIQAGGSPVTALIQQGSQLSGVFGGTGNALRAVASLISPAVLGFGAAAAALAAVGYSFSNAEKERTAFTRGLALTGNAVGQTAGALDDAARAVGGLVGGQSAASQALALYVASGQQAGASLQVMTEAALRLQRVGGPAVEDTVKAFSDLAKDPLKASVQLNESTNFLTVSIYRQVKALQDQGKSTEAARVAQQAFADESIARAKNIEGSLGTLERGWIGVKDAIIGAKEALLDIGRQQTSGQQVAKLQKDIDSFTEELGGEGISAERFASLDAARQKLIDLQSALQSDIRLQNQSATASAERARAVKDAIKGDEEAARAAKRHAEELKRLIEAGRQLLQGNSLEDAGFSASFIRDMQALQAYAKSAGLSTEQLTQAIDGLLEKQPFAVAQAKALEAVARALADARNAEAKAIEDYLAKQQAARQQAIDSAKERLSSFKDEEQALQIVRDRNFSLAEAVEMVAIARLEEKRAKLIDGSQAARDLDKEIAARRELLGLIGIRAARDANEKAAKDAADAWQRTVEQTGQSLADALMQGGRSAREYIVGLFRTLTLKPIIQAVVQPLVGATSALLPGLASAGSTAANAGGALGSLGNVASLLTSSFSSSLGSVVSSAGSLFGSSALSSFGAGLQGSSLAAGLAGPTTAGASGAIGLGSSFAAAAPYVAAAVALFAAKDSLFGRKLKDTSIVGTFGGDVGFSGSTEQFFKGGLFRSNKTTTQALGAELADPLAAGAKAVRDQVEAYAAALALPTQAVASFTESIKFSVKDLSPDQINAKLQEALASYGQSLAGTLSADIGPFAKAGEKAGDTLARLATSLGNVNPLLSQLGLDLLGVGAAGGDAASKLVDLFGGFDKLGSSAGQFYQQFYSEQERADQARKALAASLADVGLSVPATRDAFRDLVEAQDLTTNSGRAAFATLLEVSGAFAEMTPATGELAETLRDTAAIAQERVSLEERLLALQGDTAALRERERSALDESNRALYDQIAALEAQAAAADAAAQAAEAAAQLAAQVRASVDGIVGDFVSGPELQRYRANRIAEQLGQAGIEATPEGVLGATRDDILALWRAVGDEAKLVVAELYDDWKALQIDIAQGQIDEILRGLGASAQELGSALEEINPPAESLIDAWRRGRAEMQELAAALEDIAGTRATSALDTLRATIEKRDALRGVIGGNADRIFDLRVGQGGAQAVQLLRQREADLWRQFAGTSSPEVAQAITDITLQRIQLEGSLQADANAAQIDALRGQITAAERLRDLAAEMGSFVLSLQAGELSNLSATGRLGAAQQLFDASLGTGADVQGNAQALLRQAQQTYGGASAAYSSIFEDTLAKLQSVGLGAGEQISDAQRQLDALSRVGDASDAQIAALGDLNAAFTGQLGMLEGSIGDQTRVLREQLQALSEMVANQEAQIVQAGEAYQRIVTALEGIAQGASGSDIDLALSEAGP